MIVRLLERLAVWLWPLAVANLLANIGIVVTGAAVRLTGSGLGCPTWPRCTDDSYVTHPSMGIHGAIEFGNRMLTFVLVAVAILCFSAAVGSRDRKAVGLSLVVLLGVPLQAVIGGFTVLTDLNPWIVSLHFIASMAMVMVCLGLLDHLRSPTRPAAPRHERALALAVLVVGWVVLYLGTVVTGAGPHAGDAEAVRNGLDPAVMAQVHAASVYLLVALTVALLLLVRRRGDRWLTVVVSALLVLELAQGVVGWSQYLLDLNEVLVALHMLGAGLLAAGFARVWLATRAHEAGDQPGGRLLAWASGSTATR
ncbi:COX15/CtaA family protein [Nocardioides sp. Y6]|uniref:COX15/CtaA family protein n=1 Tax=Nocardioides malaquae TaxID=2773426 RepID=A0ABR9RS49_9ACTN|nr:COX15/CtaA family protein [Nocardioides malaquae]MBE7324381.1 COX15/CtaA family protein [Nocardioides malaquae]